MLQYSPAARGADLFAQSWKAADECLHHNSGPMSDIEYHHVDYQQPAVWPAPLLLDTKHADSADTPG